jgi:uncharacterized protein YunC (DUF1805 family)
MFFASSILQQEVLMATKKELVKRIAQLESVNDQLSSELVFLDKTARELGFQEGLKTLKAAAKELLEEQENEGLGEDPPLTG